MDHAALYALHIVVVRIHEVHAGQHQGAVSEALLLAFAAAEALIGQALEGLQELVEVQALGRFFLVEELAQAVPGLQFGEELNAALAGLARQHVHFLHHGTDVDELRHRRGLAVLVHEQVGAQRAVRVAAQGGDLLAAERAEELRKRRHAGEREPVFVRIGNTGLFLYGVGEIGESETLGFQFVARNPAGKGHRLEADAAGALDVLKSQPEDVANLVIVEALDDGGDEDDLQAGLLDVLDALQLLLPQRLAARAAVDVVADAVELEVQSVKSRLAIRRTSRNRG